MRKGGEVQTLSQVMKDNNTYPIHTSKTVTCHLTSSHRGLSLVASSTRSSVAFPPQPQKHLLEAREVRCARTSARKGLALAVLEVDKVANALPGGARRQGVSKLQEELLLSLPARQDQPVSRWSSNEGSGKERALVLADGFLLLRRVLLIKLIDGLFGLANGLLAFGLRGLITLLYLVGLLLPPRPGSKGDVSASRHVMWTFESHANIQ